MKGMKYGHGGGKGMRGSKGTRRGFVDTPALSTSKKGLKAPSKKHGY